jgi:hypothetical protein
MVKTDAVERWGMPREHGDGGEYVETVTLDDVRAVFGEVRGPVVLSADVADALGCSRETARRKLGALYDQGEVDRRKVSRRVLYWKHRDGDAPTMDEGLPSGPGDVRRDSVGEDAARADAGDDPTEHPADPPTDAHDADAVGEEETLDTVLADLPSTVDPDAAREAILAAREYLIKHGTATKADFVREVMRDHPLGYDPDAALAKIEAGERFRGAWWRRVIKPGLKAINGVEKPPRGASEWKATEGES